VGPVESPYVSKLELHATTVGQPIILHSSCNFITVSGD
jgi:hypothetical protein